ncbi:unnamed protein product [Adineta steineri]|uniref:Uncharacterized protein n=1 Tax=Adineta steineri TaxID=433720 RepID=A0A815SP33_9BILA|nr:unnamed protein product [Adineta steineri]CAF4018340.1 unnamed protein product [Adineta steineri]
MAIFLFVCSQLLLLALPILTIETKHASYMTYVITRDYFVAFKAPEYSIYNTSEKHLYYRIESKYDFQHNIKLVMYPSKKIVAKLRSQKQGKEFKAKISICNITSNQWSYGTIIQHRQWLHANYSIEWNEYHLSMITNIVSGTTRILDQSENDVLAQFYRRWFSLNYKYQLEVFSDRVPESIYLLGLAVVSRSDNG